MADAYKFVSILMLSVAEQTFDRLSHEAKLVIERKSATIPGLFAVAILGTEARDELWIISQWESRSRWARAQWDEDIGRTLTDLVESAQSFGIKAFETLAIVRQSGVT